MIRTTTYSIFDSQAEVLVNPVNCLGISGKGLALEFKKRYPDNDHYLHTLCQVSTLRPGEIVFFEVGGVMKPPRWVANFPTKRHFKDKSKMEDIVLGLKFLVGYCRRMQISSISMPMIGCGLGGLNWAEVRPQIVQAFEVLPELRVWLHEKPATT